jgi:hypothetical protein
LAIFVTKSRARELEAPENDIVGRGSEMGQAGGLNTGVRLQYGYKKRKSMNCKENRELIQYKFREGISRSFEVPLELHLQ